MKERNSEKYGCHIVMFRTEIFYDGERSGIQVPKSSSEGGPVDLINGYIKDKNKPFINRAIFGLYAPGSVVKPLLWRWRL